MLTSDIVQHLADITEIISRVGYGCLLTYPLLYFEIGALNEHWQFLEQQLSGLSDSLEVVLGLGRDEDAGVQFDCVVDVDTLDVARQLGDLRTEHRLQRILGVTQVSVWEDVRFVRTLLLDLVIKYIMQSLMAFFSNKHVF